LIGDQGELAIQLELDENGVANVIEYSLPLSNDKFSEKELRDAYLDASRSSWETDGHSSKVLSSYFSRVLGETSKAELDARMKWARTRQQARFEPSASKEKARMTERLNMLKRESASVPSLHSGGSNHHQKGKTCKRCLAVKRAQKAQEVGLTTQIPKASAFAATKKKYKPVHLKVNPVLAALPKEFRILREIKGDPLAEMPVLSTNPPDFTPTG
jgi:hypothetical protein